MLKLYVRMRSMMDSETGATATEYGILVAVIAFAIIIGAAVFGDALSAYFGRLGGVVGGWSPSGSL